MLRIILFVTGLTLLIIAVNHWAIYRSEHELIRRLCINKEEVISDLSAVLLNKVPHTDVISETRDKMIASKLRFIVPQHDGEENSPYIKRITLYLNKRCKTLLPKRAELKK